MSLISKIQSLISSANAVTGESRTDLTSAVQDLKDGYGGSTVEKGLVFSEYDSDGYPHKAEWKGTWTELSARTSTSFQGVLIAESIFKFINDCPMPTMLTTLDSYVFRNCSALTSVTIPSGVSDIGEQCFRTDPLETVVCLGNITKIRPRAFENSTTTFYDFSHNTGVPVLDAITAIGHANGCVIRIPLALSDQTLGTGNGWESQTNWVALTNIVWEAV